MKLQSKKARVPIAALGVTALVCGAGALVSPAYAAGETLSFLGLTTNTATVLNTDPNTQGNAVLAYGLRPSGTALAGAGTMRIALATGAPGALSFARAAVPGGSAPSLATLNANPAANATTLVFPLTVNIRVGDIVSDVGGANPSTITAVTPGATTQDATIGANAIDYGVAVAVNGGAAFTTVAAAASAAVPSYTSGDNVYVGATAAGVYKVRLFKDAVADGNYDSATEDATPEFTLTVKAPADAFTYSASTSAEAGANPAATINTILATKDVYGTTGATPVGILGTQIARRLGVDFTQGANTTNTMADGAPTFNGTAFVKDMAASSAGFTLTDPTLPGSVTSRPQFGGVDIAGLSLVTTAIASNGVTALALAAGASQTANVTGTTAVSVRSGTDTVTYTATATGAASAVQANKSVVFTLGVGSGTLLTDLTANGAAVPTNGKVTVTTGSDGVATLAVKSTKTANTNAYTVDATSGAASGSTITATYRSAAATTFTTSGGAAGVVGGSVTLKGKILDQWLQGIATGGQVTLAVTRGGGIGTDISRGVDVLADGTFSTVVADGSTTNTTAHTDTFVWTAPVTGTTTSAGSIFWVTSLNVATTAITGLGANTTFPVPSTFTPTAATPTSLNAINLTGTLKDGATSPAVVPYAPFTLSGTAGVKFMDNAGKVTDTFTGMATAAGLLSDGTNAYVRTVFTKSGANTITVTSGTATSTSGAFTTAVPTVPWKISVNDATSAPGSTIIVTGKITDLFGNGVPSYNALLDLGATTIGTLGDTTPTTNSDGVFSTTFVSGSNQSGEVTLKATLPTTAGGTTAMTTNPLIGSAYATTGFTVDAHGEYTDQAKLTVAQIKLTLLATAKLVGGGKAEISGAFSANTGVDVYSKASGAESYTLLDSVETDAEGEYGASYSIKKTTAFLVKSAGLSSKVATTTVMSKVTLTGKSYSRNRATLWANGSPSAKGTLTFYRSVAGKDPILKSMTSNSGGNGMATVKLPKGTRSVYVIFKAPGTGAGTSKTLKIMVK